MSLIERQKSLCVRYATEFVATDLWMKAGVARNLGSGDMPLHGLRHAIDGLSSGWYLWAGEYSEVDDFFEPMHVSHVFETFPSISDFLGLPPGWRFLLAPGQIDVWFDRALLTL